MPAPLESTMLAVIPTNPGVGDMEAKVWPHLSVMPWVQLGEFRSEVLAEMDTIVSEAGPLELRPGSMMAIGGEGHEKRAQRIVSEELRQLHIKLLYCLGSFGIMVSHPEWAGKNYLPHMTSETPLLLARTTVDKIHIIDNIALRPEDSRGTKIITGLLGGER